MDTGRFYRNYEDISRYVLRLLLTLSAEAAKIHETALALQKYPVFHVNGDFAQFLQNLDSGRHLLSRSQGAMETMVSNSTYSADAIYNWYTNLYAPARHAFYLMYDNYRKMTAEPAKTRTRDFGELSRQADVFMADLKRLEDGVTQFYLE